jgi:hypothetical protein
MPTLGEGAIGSLDYTKEERRTLAKKSLAYHCPTCKIESSSILPMLTEKSQQESAEAKELASQIEFKVSSLVYRKESFIDYDLKGFIYYFSITHFRIASHLLKTNPTTRHHPLKQKQRSPRRRQTMRRMF